MAENSNIEWTDHTFNPWIGCTKVSVGPQGACVKCYAEVATPVRAMHIQWGAGKPRHRTSPATWAQPLKWERAAAEFQAEHGRRQRIFCASLADVFDNEVDPQWRADLMQLILKTPRLDWLLLTKRIGNAQQLIAEAGDLIDYGEGWQSLWGQGDWPANVWLGATVVTRQEFDRDIDKLRATPAHRRFLSMEPLMGPMGDIDLTGIDWVIVGGESGSKPRPMEPAWAEHIRYRCECYGTAFFFKQGSAANWPSFKNFDTFPAYLQERRWPAAEQR